MATRMAGTITCPSSVEVGCCRNPRRVAGRGATETLVVPDFPPVDAVMVTGPPSACAMTSPSVVTGAIEGALDCQKKLLPAKVPPGAWWVGAVSLIVPPTDRFTGLGVTVMRAAGTGVTLIA